MRLIVDSNVLFTFFWKNSVFNKLSLKQDLELYSPEYALREINKYRSEILKKAGLSQEEFKKLRRELAIMVEFIPLSEYSSFLKKVKSLARDLPDEDKIEFLNDIDFFALALRLNCPIWSNDKLFKKQSNIDVFTTEEMINLVWDNE